MEKFSIPQGKRLTGNPYFRGVAAPKAKEPFPMLTTDNANELYIDRDIMVLANPEIANLPGWVIALVAAGGLAAALSTAAGLLLVISTAISHDLLKKMFLKDITDRQELVFARMSAALAISIAGYFGIHPPGFVAQVVAFAFGLAASSFFPVIMMGIFSKRMNKEGAISGMITGLAFTASYIIYFKFINPSANTAENGGSGFPRKASEPWEWGLILSCPPWSAG